MLGNYLYFNNKQFPNPLTTSRQSKTLENVSQSEAGTDLVCVVRSSKNFWSFSFSLTPYMKEILMGLCEDESTQMTYMGTTYQVRVRNFKEKLVEGSEWSSSVDGVFECSVDVTEF
jgi:hypothetical protein